MTESRQPVITVLTAPGEDAPAGIEAVKAQAEVRFAWDEQTLRDTLPGTDVMMVTDFRTEALEAAWPAADRLQWIHATSAGVDALMFPALIKSDVIVTNARGIFDRTIAEYVLCSILMFAKDFPRSIRLQDQHQWQHRDTERAEGKQVLVVGAGSIGRQIGRLVKAIGMQDRKSTRLNSSHVRISYAVFCLKKKSNVVHAEPGRERARRDERHPDEAGVLQPEGDLGGAALDALRIDTQPAEHAGGDRDRHQELHDTDAEIAKAGIEREGVSFICFRKEE